MAGRYNRTIRATLTQPDGDAFVVNTAAYTQFDNVGGTGLMSFGVHGGGYLLGISIRDTHKQNEPYIVHIYRSTPTVTVDAAAMAQSVADGDLEIGKVTIAAADYVTANGSAFSKAYVAVPTKMGQIDESSNGDIFIDLECTETPNYDATTDIKVEGVVWIDG